LVWIRKELIDSCSFCESDCFPFGDGDTIKYVKKINFGSEQWKGRRIPSVLRIRRKCLVAEWGRGGGGGRRGRGRDLLSST
jgi:hypothetical protein